jgi:hypothetical protein
VVRSVALEREVLSSCNLGRRDRDVDAPWITASAGLESRKSAFDVDGPAAGVGMTKFRVGRVYIRSGVINVSIRAFRPRVR